MPPDRPESDWDEAGASGQRAIGQADLDRAAIVEQGRHIAEMEMRVGRLLGQQEKLTRLLEASIKAVEHVGQQVADLKQWHEKHLKKK